MINLTSGRESVGNLPRANRTREAYFRIKQEIMRNDLPPGFQCMETELAQRLGISRTPVHEALVKLAEDGLIELRQRRGMRVLPISVQEMRDIYDLLQMLEPECAAALVGQGLSQSQLSELAATVIAMEAAIEAGALADWAAADDRFHRLHLDYARNRRLAKIIGQLLDQAHRVRMFTLKFRKVPRMSTADHAKMVHLLEHGSAEHVRRLYRQHRENAAIELFEILERYDLRQL
ncbi:MAG: GntR family transcriptional regulator [Hyphomicrobiaceae bacterium]